MYCIFASQSEHIVIQSAEKVLKMLNHNIYKQKRDRNLFAELIKSGIIDLETDFFCFLKQLNIFQLSSLL